MNRREKTCLRKQSSKFVRQQDGFSLIELMVAVAVGLLITAAILQLFFGVLRTNDEMARTNAQIENGRFAIQLLGNDLMLAGFWAGYIPKYDDLTAVEADADYPNPSVAPPTAFDPPAPCVDSSSWANDYKNNLLRMPAQSYNGVPAGCSDVIQNRKEGTDVLVVRYAEGALTALGDIDPDKVYFQASNCSASGVSPYSYVLGKTGFSLTKMNCTSLADIRRYIAHIYFVRNDNTLMRAVFSGGSSSEWSVQPLIDGVEGFVVEWGVDNRSDTNAAVDYGSAIVWADALNKTSPTNRGDGAPDGNFIRCPATGCSRDQLLNFVAAKLYLLVRNPEVSPGFSDGKTYALGSAAFTPTGVDQRFKRHLYSSSVRLVNISSRRETP